MASFEQALRVYPLHQTSFDKHKGFTLLHMGTEPHCVRAFYFPMFVRSSFQPITKKARYIVAGFLVIWRLEMTYSHMGRPHTTIGAIAFHF
ncbi:hypothetical protein, partial [Shewanella waksmanii]|uniref:hypothetical protein n=1 Tax=Shewanella waksmanii TaxID=213783 RepID=UPI003735F7D7